VVVVDEATVRRLALALPEAVEQPHHGFPSFRVRGKIFATMPEDGSVNVMLTPDEIREAVAIDPAGCRERWWGEKLAAVQVILAAVDEDVLGTLLRDAWRGKAPASLVAGDGDGS
jgi:hypothetical protein